MSKDWPNLDTELRFATIILTGGTDRSANLVPAAQVAIQAYQKYLKMVN